MTGVRRAADRQAGHLLGADHGGVGGLQQAEVEHGAADNKGERALKAFHDVFLVQDKKQKTPRRMP
ncbi:hypothetical protein GCM10011290_20400 [Vogesella alkaliphila]|uniref:Uncharacterized protein n=1 Tax=Vogesella alkaliphila TaxID=1193621 RepID=A0ABQ2YR37_9NEIS|nr:hypothetical protein GCM10011290_20400 [Vogesella alkaliphila]